MAKQLPAGASQGVLAKLAEGVAEALHRFYCITQWHRSPFDPQNEDPAFLHRCVFVLGLKRVCVHLAVPPD